MHRAEHEGTHQGWIPVPQEKEAEGLHSKFQVSLGCMLVKTLPLKGNKTAYADTEVNGGPYPMASHYSMAQSRQEHHTILHGDRCHGESTAEKEKRREE